MDLGLKGRIAIVTGASKGIGRTIAETLAEEGAAVLLVARGREPLDEAVDAIRRAQGTAAGFAADVSRVGAAEAVAEAAIAEFGAIDILVNNAGGQRRRARFDELRDQDFIDAFEDNVLSVVRLVRAVLPSMRARKWGRIVNIVSDVATQPQRVSQHYNAAKAAQLNLSKSLSQALGVDGILVNAVAPGLISTPAVEESFARGAREQDRPIAAVKDDFLRRYRPGLVVARAGEPAEVAAVVALLASERCSYVTGANFRVDGGAVLGIG